MNTWSVWSASYASHSAKAIVNTNTQTLILKQFWSFPDNANFDCRAGICLIDSFRLVQSWLCTAYRSTNVHSYIDSLINKFL